MNYFNHKHDPNNEFEPNVVENNEGGLLSKLFRIILKDTGKVNLIGVLIQKYYDRETKKNANTPNIVKVRNKSTMLANAKLTSMSIKVFLSLLRDLFCIKWLRITLELEWPDGKITSHQLESKLSGVQFEEYEEEKPNGKKDVSKNNSDKLN